MKTAEDVAREILLEYEKYPSHDWLKNSITKALTAYTDQTLDAVLSILKCDHGYPSDETHTCPIKEKARVVRALKSKP